MRIVLLLDFFALITGYSQGFLFPIEPEQPQEYPPPPEYEIPINFMCPSPFGTYPDPTDCSRYISCSFNEAVLRKCFPQLLFSPSHGHCTGKQNVYCGARPNPYNNNVADTSSNENQGIQNEVQHILPFLPVIGKLFRCPKAFGTYADPENCGRFYVCSYMVPLNYRCLFGLVFNDYSGRCMAKRYVDCGKRPLEGDVTTTTIETTRTTKSRATRPPKTTKSYVTTTNVPTTTRKVPQTEFICPKMFGMFPDPDNCGKYFTCLFSKATHQTCTSGMLFDSKGGYCRRRKKVKCGSRPDPESITTGKETTITEPPKFKTTATPYIKLTTRMENITTRNTKEITAETKMTNFTTSVVSHTEISGFTTNVVNVTDVTKVPLTTKLTNTTTETSGIFSEDIRSSSVSGKNTTKAITEIPPLTTKIMNTTDEISRLFTEDIGSTSGWNKNTTEAITEIPPLTTKIVNTTDEISRLFTEGIGSTSGWNKNTTEVTTGETFVMINQTETARKFTATNIQDITLISDATKEDEENFECPALFGVFPHEKNCAKFYVCFAGQVTQETCNYTELFDAKTLSCKESHEVDCGSRYIPTAEVSLEFTRTTPVDTTESITWPYSLKTTDSTLLETSSVQSETTYQSSTTVSTLSTEVTPVDGEFFKCPAVFGIYPHPQDCSKYFVCFSGKVSGANCHESQLFDTNYFQCRNRNEVDCGNRYDPIEIEDAFECPIVFGIYPHPRDCSRFIICFGGKVSSGKCNPTQLFDMRFYQCHDKDDVKCGNRFNPFTDQAGERSRKFKTL